jgi:hypothetical protein
LRRRVGGGGADWRGVGYGRRDVRPDEEAGKGYSGISIWDRIVLVFLFYYFIIFHIRKSTSAVYG